MSFMRCCPLLRGSFIRGSTVKGISYYCGVLTLNIHVQAASFNYDMLFKVAKAVSDEVRAKVILEL